MLLAKVCQHDTVAASVEKDDGKLSIMTFHCGTQLMKPHKIQRHYCTTVLPKWWETDTCQKPQIIEQGLIEQMENSLLVVYLPSGWCKRKMGRCAGGERPRTVQRTASCKTDRENYTCRQTERFCISEVQIMWSVMSAVLTDVSRQRRVRPGKSGRCTGQDQTLAVTGATTEKQTITHIQDEMVKKTAYDFLVI